MCLTKISGVLPCLPMAIHKLGDAQVDFDAWKEVRKGYLSSSEMFTWLGNVPDWWKDRPEDVLAGKRKHGFVGVFVTLHRRTSVVQCERSLVDVYLWRSGESS